MLIAIVLLLTGFVLVVKGADWLVHGSSSLALKYKVPEIVIGLTIVAFGTSTPEFIVTFFSSIAGKNDFALGNIVGSNLFNTLIVLGIASLICPIVVNKNTVWKEIPFSLIVTIIAIVLLNDHWYSQKPDGLGFFDAMIFLILFIFFIIYNFVISKVQVESQVEIQAETTLKIIVLIIIGLAGLISGGKLVVKNATVIAQYFHISEKIIGLTILSVGTSLPELATSIVAAIKKKPDIVVGNVIGSNIFNLIFVLGVSASIKPIAYNSSFNKDFLLLIISSFCLFLFMFCRSKHKIDRIEGSLFILIYVFYMFSLK